METNISINGLADIHCNIFPNAKLLAELFGSANYSVASIFYFSGFKNEHALGIQVKGGFLVLKGSVAAMEESNKLPLCIKRLRSNLKENTVLLEKEDKSVYVFAKPHLFNNETEATRVICGNVNDRFCPTQRVWRDSLGKQPLEYKIEDNVVLSRQNENI